MQINTVSPKTVQQWIEDKEAVVFDVRSQEEYDAEHIEGAILHSMPNIDIAKIKELAKGKKIVFHCNSGGRAGRACEAFGEEAFVIKNSLQGWKQAGLPTVAKKVKMSLERQVLAIAGSLVVTGFVFGSIFSSNWYFLSLFVGAGLTYAGFSGNCMLKKLLMELPYNKNN